MKINTGLKKKTVASTTGQQTSHAQILDTLELDSRVSLHRET